MSVEALFTVNYKGKRYKVEVCYNAGKSVVGVKKLIVAELKSNYDGFDTVKNRYLTLKTLDGTVIEADEIPEGKKFLADLDESLGAKSSASNHASCIIFTTFLLAIGLLIELTKSLGKRSYKVSDWFPDDFRKMRKVDHDDEKGDSCGERTIKIIEMRDLPPMVNKNDEYGRVYVRHCYVTLFDELVKLIKERSIKGARFNAMMTGNPGIGKSYFYLYVIFRFIKEPSLLGNWKLVINSGAEFHILIGNTFQAIHPKKI